MYQITDPSPLGIVELLSKQFPQIQIPEEFVSFLKTQEENNHQLRHLASGKPLFDFFVDQNTPLKYFSTFLSPDSRLLPKIDYRRLIELNSDEVYSYLLDNFSYTLDLQQTVLDSEILTGFNRHGREHIHSVVNRAIDLLADLTPKPLSDGRYQNETIIGGLFHDVGNLLARKYHGLYGIYLITQLFVNYAIDSHTLESFLSVLEIVLFHEVEYGSRLPTLLLLRPSTLALIVADKTDISFRRVSPKSNVPEAIQDAHVLVNLLVASSSVERIKGDSNRFRWEIDFKPKFDPEQVNLFSSLLKATGRVKYPKEWEMLYEEGKVEYLLAFNVTFLTIFLSRIYFTIRAAFALFPSIDDFQLVINDEERAVSFIRTFTRNDYRERIFTLGKLFYRENWPNTYLYSALSQQSEIV